MKRRISSILLCIAMVAAVFTVMPTGAGIPVMDFQKTADRMTANPGDTIVFTLEYENTGPDDAFEVTISDTLPDHTTFVSSTLPPFYVIGNTYTWNIPTVPSGSSGSISIILTVNNYVVDGTILINSATLDYKDDLGISAPQLEDNAAVTVTAPIMWLSKEANTETANPGDTVTYLLEFENSGAGTATGVTITDTIPADTSFLNAYPSPATSNGDTYTWNIGSVVGLSIGAITIYVTVDAGLPYGTLLENEATLDYNDVNGNPYPQLYAVSQVTTILPVDAQGPYGTQSNPLCVGDIVAFQADILGDDVSNYLFRWDIDNDGFYEYGWGVYGETDYFHIFMNPFIGQARVDAWDGVTWYGGNPVITTDIADVYVYCPVHNVNTNEYFDGINEAIQDTDTQSSHVIEVDPGTYVENVVVDESIKLTGSGKTTTFIDGGGTGNTVEITVNGVEVSGFNIMNGGSGPGDSGIKLSGVEDCIVDNNELSGNGNIDIIIDSPVSPTLPNTISNNDIISSNLVGIMVTQDSKKSVISGNTIQNHDQGIWLFSNSEDNDIIGNVISNNGDWGIYLQDSDLNTISGNTITNNNFYGIWLSSNSDDNDILNNLAISNHFYGISLSQSSSNDISGNTISDNTRGINLEMGSTLNNIFTNTAIIRNTYGIYVDNSDENDIYHNYNINTQTDWGIYILSSDNGEISFNIINYCGTGLKLDNSNQDVHDNTITDCTITPSDIDPSSAIIENNFLGYSPYGMIIDDSSAFINSNTIVGCTYGIYIYHSDPLITDNIFEDNVYAIFVAEDSNPILINNTFVNNTYNAYFMVWDMDIDPDTLNLKSEGRWITCYLEPSEDVDLSTVDISTIRISDIGGLPVMIPTEVHPSAMDDGDGDGKPDLMIKFDRSEVQDAAWPGDIEIKVEGELTDGTPFEGYCTIRVINPGK